jgi:phosphoribosylaminoimidazole-succinocarboxamide synthase
MAKALDVLYRGSVKDLLGPVRVADHDGRAQDAVFFQYTDAFSVFDWGRMPDALPRKGEALAVMAAHFFEQLAHPETWKEFSKTPQALALRKANRFGSNFNEWGERLQREGTRTHFLGVVSQEEVCGLKEARNPVSRIAVRQVSAVKPVVRTVMGRQVPDYTATRASKLPRLVPLEVVFRFAAPQGSSLYERVERDPGYLTQLGYGNVKLTPEARFDFPILELFTKLESSDRPVSLIEGLALSGLTAEQLEALLMQTAWIAGYLRSVMAKRGLELADGKLEWAIDADGQVVLVDAIGPDELRILREGKQLSKEFLRTHYRNTDWYGQVKQAKEAAQAAGIAEWKKGVSVAPPALPAELKELGAQVYWVLANELTGRTWFPEAWSIDKLVDRLGKVIS